jgi:hypothetical protein
VDTLTEAHAKIAELEQKLAELKKDA